MIELKPKKADQGPRIHGVQGGRGPPDFENPKKLSHKNAIKPNFSEKWGKIGLLAPPDFESSRGPCATYMIVAVKFRNIHSTEILLSRNVYQRCDCEIKCP